MDEASKEAVEVDPDYESTLRAIQDVQLREAQDNQLTEEKLHHIIRDEFDKELKTRQKQIEEIEDKILKAQKLLHIIRYVLISSYYQNKALEYDPVDYEGGNILNGQNRIHPAVKKLLGGNVKSLEFLAPLGKRKSASNALISNSRDTTLSEPEAKKLKMDPEQRTISETISLSNPTVTKPKTDITIKHTDQEILTNRKKVQHQIVVGNTSLYKKTLEFENLTHKWMVYIKVYRGIKKGIEVSNIIDKVIFYLHPSYSPHDVVEISQPPFHLSRRGWGEFPLRVQIYFKSSINKPVDIIHHLKLSKAFTERQTLGNETVVPLFLYDSITGNTPTPKQSIKIKQEKIDVPEFSIKKEISESVNLTKVQIKQENLWEKVENVTLKQEMHDDSYLEPTLSSDVDSYFDTRDSFSENMSENNDLTVSDDGSWEQGFKGFRKEEITDLEHGYYSFNGKDDIDVDAEECNHSVHVNNTKFFNSNTHKPVVKNINNKIQTLDNNIVVPENNITIIEDIQPKQDNTLVKKICHLNKNVKTEPSETSVKKSNIKTNSSIWEHSYSLPFYKEDSGAGRRHSPKKNSPAKQPPNNLIYGLGTNYESSTNHQKPSPQVLKVLRTASGQSIRLLPESFSQMLLNNGGIVQLKLLQNPNTPNATTQSYAISNSDLLKLTLKPPWLTPNQTARNFIKLPKERFKNMGEALPYIFKQLPLWSDKANDVKYKAMFPFTARSKEEFLSWSFSKRVNSEWCRAKTIKSFLASEKYAERWNTKAILMYGRSHFVVPQVQYNLFTSDFCEETRLLANVFKDGQEGRRGKFAACSENGNDGVYVDPLGEEIDSSTKSHPPKPLLNLVDQKRVNECAFVKEQTLSCGILLKPEELCKGVYMNAPERIIFEAVKSFAEGMIRRARYFAIARGNYSEDDTPISSQDVLTALNDDRPEFKAIETFQKTKLTKDFFS